TTSGLRLGYDALILATGARRHPWLDGAITFRGAPDVEAIRALLADLEASGIDRLVFAAPPAESWTLPRYELALLTAGSVAERGLAGVRLTIVTPEPFPLALFGPRAGAAVRQLLGDRGIRLLSASYPVELAGNALALRPAASVPADRVITLAHCEGLGIAGLPHDAHGFIPTDRHARVDGVDHVYAAGDGTTFPIKQGGIAAQQADAAAEAVAATLGAPIEPQPFKPVLRGMLLTGLGPTYLRADISGAAGDSFEFDTKPLWWPPAKIAGEHLGPYLARRAPWSNPVNLADLQSKRPDVQTHHDHSAARERAFAAAPADPEPRERLTAIR
ncbi:MAG: NAD(P)/FAD-dependent oxidoreductase, partial [Solirubrobacteraceae bacterium]